LALKRAQREVLMKQGIRLATWTFDPMMSLNAYLNIRRLGAVCDTYLRDLYGSLEDKLNAGLPSDRFQVDWWITTARVKVRLEESRAQLDLAHYLSVGAQKVNPASLLDDDLPRPSNSIETPQETFLLAEIPPSFQDLKRADPGLALAWRQHGRELFERLFKAGYLVTDFIYLKGERLPRSYYVLTHGEGTLG
jgi:predicted GNAT superfamily acetyltransferase